MAFFADDIHLISFSLPVTVACISTTTFLKNGRTLVLPLSLVIFPIFMGTLFSMKDTIRSYIGLCKNHTLFQVTKHIAKEELFHLLDAFSKSTKINIILTMFSY